MRTLRARKRRLDAREVELDHVGVIGGLRTVDTPHSLSFGVRLDQRDLLLGPAGELEIAHGLLVDRENGAGRAELRRHVGDGGAVRERQALQAIAEELDELVDDAFLAQDLRDHEHEIGRGGTGGQSAGELEPDHLGNEHGHGLPEHRGLGLDAADTPAEDAETVDHGGVRISPDKGIGEGARRRARLLREHDAREALEIDLVDDAGVRRHDFEIAERRLAPAQEHVALAVAVEFDLVVVLERARRAVFVDLHRVIDHELGGRQRIHPLRITAQLDDRLAHGRKVHDAGHAGEVLHDHACRCEGDLVMRGSFRIPGEQGLDVTALDVHAVLEAQQVLEQDLQGKRQSIDALGFKGSEAQDLVLLRAYIERRLCLEAVRHDPSSEKREL